MADIKDVEHYFNGDQVLRRAWDAGTDALKVIPSENTQFSIELNAEDGDSVLALADCVTLSLHNSAVDCRRMRRCALYGNAQVLVSPLDDGDVFIALPINGVTEICAKRVKIIIAEGAEAHLVLQS
jgi:hypothetical protein